MDAIAQSMIDGFNFKHRLWQKPVVKPMRYDPHLLEMARQYEANGGAPILNPRDVTERSLFNADADWMRDKARHAVYVQWAYDRKRPLPENSSDSK